MSTTTTLSFRDAGAPRTREPMLSILARRAMRATNLSFRDAGPPRTRESMLSILARAVWIPACAGMTVLTCSASTVHAESPTMPAYTVSGDSILAPLDGLAGDAARGRAIVANRQVGLCLLCHSAPIPEERFQGNLAPDLAGAGARWSVGQLRLRIVDPGHFNRASIMPAYYTTEGLQRVPAALQGRTLFTAQQVEDVVAWLQTLQTPATAAPIEQERP